VGRTLTRAQLHLLLHGDLLLQRRARPDAGHAGRGAADPAHRDTRKMAKREYLDYVWSQMGTSETCH